MKLTSMKRESDDSAMGGEYTPPNYPGGLCLYLNEDQCEALGITKSLKAGTQLTVQAQAIVTSSTESLERDGDDKGNDVCLTIQITDMGISVNGVVRNAAEFLYGSGGN